MAHVIVLDSIEEDIFVCGPCKTVFNSLQEFLDHKRSKCSSTFLGEKLTNINDVQPAAVTTPSAGSFATSHQCREIPNTVTQQIVRTDLTCSTCKKKFKMMKSFLTHLKTHSDKPYQCPICGRCFIQNSHLQRHILSHKIWPDGLKDTTARALDEELLGYNCSYCNLILPNYSQYRAHLKNHVSLKKFKCIQGDCMDFYDTVENLIHHVTASHEYPHYSCHLCSSSFGCLEDIAAHLQSHKDSGKDIKTKLKLYKCSQCDARFRTSEKLSLHMLTENHQKVCIHCNKTFASDKRLRLHLQIHRKLKPYQCHICNNSFHMKKYLSTHMLKHGNRQFKCSVCKYMFKRQDLLQRHMKSHQAKKMFKCPFRETLNCKKEFSRSDKLKLHIKSHTKHMNLQTSSKAKVLQDNCSVELCAVPLNTKTNNK